MRQSWHILALLCFPIALFAQKKEPPRDLIEQRIEIAAERFADESDIDLTTLFDVLVGYYQNPLELNTAKQHELADMQLLTDIEIAALLDHMDRNGKLISLYELQSVKGWDMNTIRLIAPFVKVGGDDYSRPNITFKEIFKNGKHEVIMRYKHDIEQRKGFRYQDSFWGNGNSFPQEIDDPSDAQMDSLRENNKVYLGNPIKLYTRYRFKYRNNVSFGFTAEKDEGEEFFKGTQKQGFDYYSGHLYLRDIGRIKQLAIGDYQAQFGQGLTFWSGFGFSGKGAYTMNIKRSAPGIIPYTSVNENLFMRGAAGTVALGNIEVSTFFSKKKIDGNRLDPEDILIGNDEALAVTSFQESGFHRTTAEVADKHAIPETQYGGHVAFKTRKVNIGVTAAHIEFDADLQRNLQPYNQFDFNSNQSTNIGLDYNFVIRNLNFFGEVARSENGGMAYLSGVLMAIDSKVSLSVLYRNYARDFQGIRSAAFSESSNPWNERGLYMGLEIRPSRKFTFNAYFDQFNFDWLRYQTDAPSRGFDVFSQLTYRPNKQLEMYGRVRHRNRPRNTEMDVEGIDYVVEVAQTNYRYNVSYKVTKSIKMRNRLEVIDYARGETPKELGYLIYHDVVFRPLSSPWQFTLRYALFDTDSYDARVYAYENDIPGYWSIPGYSGRGTRLYLMLRYSATKNLDLWVRYGQWYFNDRDEISSGLQQIDGNVRSELKAALRLKF